jgi:hypothetical protein
MLQNRQCEINQFLIISCDETTPQGRTDKPCDVTSPNSTMFTAYPTFTVPGSNSCFRVDRRTTKCFVTRTNFIFPGFRGEWCFKENESAEFTILQVESEYLQRVGRETQRVCTSLRTLYEVCVYCLVLVTCL